MIQIISIKLKCVDGLDLHFTTTHEIGLECSKFAKHSKGGVGATAFYDTFSGL